MYWIYTLVLVLLTLSQAIYYSRLLESLISTVIASSGTKYPVSIVGSTVRILLYGHSIKKYCVRIRATEPDRISEDTLESIYITRMYWTIEVWHYINDGASYLFNSHLLVFTYHLSVIVTSTK